MNTIEYAPQYENMPDFGMEAFGMSQDFDINAAFQEAIDGIASDSELELDEKVRRMEAIVSEGTSEAYRDFINFSQMAAQMEMMCNHDHALNQSMQSSEALSGFMSSHKAEDGHSHSNSITDKDKEDTDDEFVIDPKTGRRVRKSSLRYRSGWFTIA